MLQPLLEEILKSLAILNPTMVRSPSQILGSPAPQDDCCSGADLDYGPVEEVLPKNRWDFIAGK